MAANLFAQMQFPFMTAVRARKAATTIRSNTRRHKAGARDAWDFPALGKGYVDFKTLFNKLDKANNDAPLSLEIEFTAKGPKDLDEINTAVKESAVYLKNLGYKI